MSRHSKLIAGSLGTMALIVSIGIANGAEDLESKNPGIRERLKAVLESWFPSSSENNDSVTSDDIAGPPGSFEDDPSHLNLSDVLSEEELKKALPWRTPVFSGQTAALGWDATVFDIPQGMEERVAFWREIYGKYTSQQGVLHDSDLINVVYAAVDFTPIMQNQNLSLREKAKEREALVERTRASITDRLLRLQSVTSPDDLSGEDLRIWKLFEKIDDPQKFVNATQKGRVRFQLGQKDRFLYGIYHSGRYLRQMERIFRDENLPIELTRLPFVESSFNINARSKVGASGIWQFMPRTAKSYMRVSKDIDERNDPLIATRASARLLKENYMMLKKWPLAVTGYNHGPYGVRQIVSKVGTDNLADIIGKYNSTTFGFASENFYACFLAAIEVEKNAEKFFAAPKWSPEVESAELKASRPVPWKELLEFFDKNEKLASLLNPAITSRVREGRSKIPMGTLLRVPMVRLEVARDYMRGKVTPSKLVAKLKDVPMPKTLDSAASAIEASNSEIRTKLMKPSEAATAVLPDLVSDAPAAVDETKTAPLATPSPLEMPN